jgi:lysozyme
VDQDQAGDQIETLVAALGGKYDGELPPALDVEGANLAPADVPLIEACLDDLGRATRRTPLIYIGLDTYERLGHPARLGRFPLWLPHYRDVRMGPGVIPLGNWTNWKFWQWTNQGHVPGIAHAVDLDAYFGTAADLRSEFGLTALPMVIDPALGVE